MRIFSISAIVILLAGLLGGAALPASAQAAITVRIETVDITAFPQVSLRLSAWSAEGLPLANITPQDITLREGGGAPFHPETVQADDEAPLSVVLVIDISGSMQGQPLADAQIAAARFLDRLQPGDRAALVAFSGDVNPDPAVLDPAREMALTGDMTGLYDRIEALQAGGATHLYNAVEKAVRMLEEQPSGHRAILLLSDGRNDPADVGDPQAAIGLAKASGVPVFVIGLGGQIDEAYLRGLAVDTGGVFRDTPRSSELADLFAEMAALLKTQYTVTYTSTLPTDGGTYTLDLALDLTAGKGSAGIELGPLPLVATEIPQPTAALPEATSTPLPPTPTSLPPQPTATPETPPPPDPFSGILPFLIGGGLLLLLVILWLVLRGKNKQEREFCARCGRDLTDIEGPCPQCGETKRLKKPRV